MKNTRNNKRKMAVAVLAGLALTGIIGASAASLGGIDGQSLGADAADVVSCDTNGVNVSYDTNFVPGSPNGLFDVDSVTVYDVAFDCDGLDFELVLLNDMNTPIGQADGQVALDDATDDDFDVALTGTIDAELVTGIALTISGTIVTGP